MSNLPGTRIHKYDHDDDDQALADWMMGLLDTSPDRLTIIEVPPVRSDHDLDELEETTRRAFNIAKEERPNLTVKTIPGTNVMTGERRILLALHEHRWVGGECVNGCRETRETN